MGITWHRVPYIGMAWFWFDKSGCHGREPLSGTLRTRANHLVPLCHSITFNGTASGYAANESTVPEIYILIYQHNPPSRVIHVYRPTFLTARASYPWSAPPRQPWRPSVESVGCGCLNSAEGRKLHPGWWTVSGNCGSFVTFVTLAHASREQRVREQRVAQSDKGL